MTLPPMQQRVYEAIRDAGRRGISTDDIAYAIRWWEPGHGPLSDKTIHSHIRWLRARGVDVVSFYSATGYRYRLASGLAPALDPALVSVDLAAPLDGLVPRQLLGWQPGHLHNDLETPRRDVLPLIDRKPLDAETPRNRKHQPTRTRNLLQPDASRHSNLISNAQAEVKTIDK